VSPLSDNYVKQNQRIKDDMLKAKVARDEMLE
jgi:hypothetical protein